MVAARRAEEYAVAQANTVFLKVSDGIYEVERLHIKPSEISRFDGSFDVYAGKFGGYEIKEEISVAAQICE